MITAQQVDYPQEIERRHNNNLCYGKEYDGLYIHIYTTMILVISTNFRIKA